MLRRGCGPASCPEQDRRFRLGVLEVRNIVLLADGTGNAAASVWRTNVWRIFESLDRSSHWQIVHYDDGIGTSSFLPDWIFGLMFGKGLKAKVLHFYEFLCRTYSDGDKIYAFGFSRGAFTIHTVVGMIADQGLVKFHSEKELHQKAKAAYRAYRLGHLRTKYRRLLPGNWLQRNSYDRSQNRQVASIRFVGLWDTVAAYGLPVEEMARGVSRWLPDLRLPNRQLSKTVQRACHALSLDDERMTFHPMLWDESQEVAAKQDETGRRYTKDERISQVWFSGVHANVGGGYPDDSLAHVSLCWMMQEAARCGLDFKQSPVSEPDAFRSTLSMKDDNGRLYDSRKGFQRLYRYGPRKLADLCHTEYSHRPEDRVEIATPKIHYSVFDRIRSGTDQYRPIGLPEKYEVVSLDGEIVVSSKYETISEASARAQFQERAWDIVFKRKIVQFVAAFLIVILLSYPLFRSLSPMDEYYSSLRWISDLVRLAGVFLPAALSPWIDGYARSSSAFIVLLSAIFYLNFKTTRYKQQIQDDLRAAWALPGNDDQTYLPDGLVYKFRTGRVFVKLRRGMRLRLAPFAYGMTIGSLVLYLGFVTANRFAYLIQDSAGVYCSDDTSSVQLDVREAKVVEFPISTFCFYSGIAVRTDQRYLIRVDPTGIWTDGHMYVNPAGMKFTDFQPWLRPLKLFVEPLKRSFGVPWYAMIVRVAREGGDELYVRSDADSPVSEVAIRPRISGRLYLYINDAVLGVPYLENAFYRNNSGSVKVTITRLR